MDLQTVLTALRNADAAGDTQAAQRLAQIAQSMQGGAGQVDDIDNLTSRLKELQAQQAELAKPKTTFGGYAKEAFKGLVPGAIGLVETAGTGIASMLPDSTEKAAREKIKELAGIAKKPFEAAPGYEDSITRKLSEGLGSTLPFFAAGPFGLAGRVAAGGLGVAAGAGEARQAAEAKGATGSERATATLLGAPTGLLDIIAPEIKPFKSLMLTAAARGGIEGATEAAQKIAQNLIAKGVYDPQQEIFVGSGEEGAYGAGVGALASLIVDMTIGRKARRAQLGLDKEAPAAPETKPVTPLLGYEATPFTPVAMPDGSVITSKADFDAYQAGKGNKARQSVEDQRTSDPLSSLPKEQRDFARRSKEAGLAEAFGQELEKGQLGLPGVERADGTVEVPGRGRVAPQAAEEVAAPKESAAAPKTLGVQQVVAMTDEQLQAQLNNINLKDSEWNLVKNELETRKTRPGRQDTQTRDMIDELETQQANELVARDQQATQQSKAEQERLKFESDIAELTGRLEDKQKKTSQDTRLTLLLPIVESNISNIPKAFDNALRAEGITALEFTEREKALIKRAYDIRLAEEPVVAEETTAQPEGQTAELETLVPEKKTTREPEQMGFPGMGKPKGPAPKAFSEEELATQEEKPFATVLTPEVLTATGLPKQSGFYKQLLNMDMANAEQQPIVAHIFGRVRENPNVTQSTKDAIERIAMQAFGGLAKQGEMFGPRGGVNKPEGTKKNADTSKPAADTAAPKRDQDTGTKAGGTGTSTESGKPSKAEDKQSGAANNAKRTETSKPAGLGASNKPAAGAGSGTGTKSGALSKADQAALQAELDAELGQTKKTETKTTYRVTYDGKPATVTIIRSTEDPTKIVDVKVKADGDQFASLNLGAQGVVTDEKMLDNLVETDIIDAKTEPKKTETKKTETKKTETKKTETKTESGTERKPKVQGAQTLGDQAWNAYTLAARGDKAKAIDYLAADIYNAMYPEKNVAKELNKIIADIVNGRMPELKFGKGEIGYNVPNTGGKYAEAFYNELTEADKKELLKRLEYYFVVSDKGQTSQMNRFNARQKLARSLKAQVEKVDEIVTAKEVGKIKKEDKVGYAGAKDTQAELELAHDATTLSRPLHPFITDTLKSGDLIGALRLLGRQQLGRTSVAANKLADVLGKTKIEFVSGLKNADGEPVAGLYDPKTDTIKLDSKGDMSVHTLLHEVAHAATSHILSNKSHPVTKQLTELYNNVKDSLDSAYGTMSLDEFVAEAFSNPEFQQKLAGINPKGEPITAWHRFTRAIGNFLRILMGKESKSLDSALDVSDFLIDGILSPAPESRGAGELYSASLLHKGSEFFKSMDDRILSMPAMDNKIAGKIYEAIREGVPHATKKLILRGLPLNALTEVAVKEIPMASQLDELEKRWNGAVDKRKRAAEATMTNVQRWIKGNPEKEATLNDVIATSTLDQVDPSKPRAYYKGQQSESGLDKQAVWDSLSTKWSKLGPEGQTIYKQMRDTYAKSYDDLIELLLSRIDASVEDKKEAAKLKKEIYQKLATKGKIEPYFPLTRFGDYRLSYDSKGEHYVEHFETSVERERAIKQLEAEGKAKNLSRFRSSDSKSYKNAPPTSFVNNVLRTLEANKVNPEVTDEVMRLFLDALPESSFAQAFRKRKNTPGFSFDATSAFYTRSMSMAHQLANLEYGAKAYKLRDEINEHVKKVNNTEIARGLADELNNHIESLVRPEIPAWAKATTSLTFAWTLGFNVSSAIVNMSQVPLIMMPYLGGKYGYSETTKALGAATRLFFGSGLKRNANMTVPTADGKSKIELKAGFSLDNYDFDAKDTPPEVKRLKELSQVAEDYGLLSRSMTSDILQMDNKSTALDRVNAWSGFIFHHGERMNRQVSLIASYNLELERMEKAGKKLDSAARTEAANNAVKISELMNGGASAGSAPLLAKSGAGKVLFMYKRYGATMYYMMFKTAREAMKSEDKEVRQAAMRQIAGTFASAGLLAGVQGLPMFGIMAAIYNIFKGDDDDDAETAARKWLGEGMYNGALNYLTGTAVANRIGLSDLLINSTGYQQQDNALLAMVQLLGGPAYGVADRIQQGVKLIIEGQVERGLERMAPSALANVMKGYRFGTEGATTLRGDPITSDIGAGSAVGQMVGLAPAEYSRQLEINAFEKGVERKALKNRSRFLKEYYVSLRDGDSDGAASALVEILKFNEKHPTAAITAETIRHSMQQHMKTSATMYHGVTFNKRLRPELLQDAAEFDSGLFGD
jgi:hypothetical protein